MCQHYQLICSHHLPKHAAVYAVAALQAASVCALVADMHQAPPTAAQIPSQCKGPGSSSHITQNKLTVLESSNANSTTNTIWGTSTHSHSTQGPGGGLAMDFLDAPVAEA